MPQTKSKSNKNKKLTDVCIAETMEDGHFRLCDVTQP